MYVIQVTPLSRGIQIDSLSYFSSEKYEPGTILTIPLRNKEVLGLVTNANEVSTTRTAIRAATFSLRRLPPQPNTQSLSPAYIETAKELAEYYASSTGAILFTMLPPEIKNGSILLPHTHHAVHDEESQTEVISAKKSDRHLSYRSLVRETFAHSGSVLIVVPTTVEADEIEHALSSGIEDRIIVLTSTITKRQLKAAYEKLEDFSKPKLIISTPSHSILERHDITVTIIEHERSPYFVERTRPYLDYRHVLLMQAKHTGRKVYLGDLLVRTETEHTRRTEVYGTHGEQLKRVNLPGSLEKILMVDKSDTSAPFKLFSTQVLEAIKETQKKKGHIFLFAARRGLAPVVTCIDCAHIFRSPETGAPYSLIRVTRKGVEERWFVCSSSGRRERAADTCPTCGSWRLRERGIGIQYVYDELSKTLGGPITLFDHTTAGTYKKACFLRDKFYGTKGSILLGTQMAVPYLNCEINTSVVVNMDALYATPTWRLQEENLGLLLALREKTNGTVFVQTRTEEDSILIEAKQGSLEQFYTDEIELRKTFNYPPFTTFIHLTWQGTHEVVKKLEGEVQTILKETNIAIYSAPPSPKGVLTQYGLIRIASQDWPDTKISNLLRTLPPSVRIVFNPDRIV